MFPLVLQDVVSLSLKGEQDMGRTRFQQKGDMRATAGWWRLRWREDRIDRDGNISYGWSRTVVIGPAKGNAAGMKAMTEKEAQRMAWDNYLSRLDQNIRTPQSIMTVREFVERKFQPEHVALLKPGGRAHYAVHLKIVLDGVPQEKERSRNKGEAEESTPRTCGLGELRLRDVSTEDCQRLVSAALSRGYSVQYAAHVRNAISAIFTHAESKEWFSGKNPAKRVNLPEMERRELRALTFDQVSRLISAVDETTRAMVFCAVLTSMNIAEVLGLRWKRVNLTIAWASIDGEALPPMHIAVREQWYLRQYGTLKKGSRRRNVPIPPELADALAPLLKRKHHKGPEDAVFASTSGKPIDPANTLKRKIRPAATALGMPWIGWHSLRRTFATLADEAGMSSGERQAMMGHATAAMTSLYTRTPTEQARGAVERMAKLISEGRPN